LPIRRIENRLTDVAEKIVDLEPGHLNVSDECCGERTVAADAVVRRGAILRSIGD